MSKSMGKSMEYLRYTWDMYIYIYTKGIHRKWDINLGKL